MVPGPNECGELVKALRLAEIDLKNRRPLILYAAPFVEVGIYFSGLTAAITIEYEAIRRRGTRLGFTLPPFTLNMIALDPVEQAVLAMERAAVLLGEAFDGVLVALLPERVDDKGAWRAAIDALRRMTSSERVRRAVLAPAEGPLVGVLGDGRARFRSDPRERVAFLMALERRERARVAKTESSGAAEHRAVLGTEFGALLLAAAEQVANGELGAATKLYGLARVMCVDADRVFEEAVVLMGLADACVTARRPELAIENYQRAAALACGENAWELVCQAWLGIGAVLVMRRAYVLAAAAYRDAADAAKAGGLGVLRIEALGFLGGCLRMAGLYEQTQQAWQEAVEVGTELDEETRQDSSVFEVASALLALLQHRAPGEKDAELPSTLRPGKANEPRR